MKNRRLTPKNYNNLLDRIGEILTEARTKVVQQINKAQVLAYWKIGREIVEFEQKGKTRGEYGEQLIERLSKDMTEKFGRGFSPTNLKMMRVFYQSFQKPPTLPAKFEPMLSWSHYCELLKPAPAKAGVEEPLARSFYSFVTPAKAGVQG